MGYNEKNRYEDNPIISYDGIEWNPVKQTIPSLQSLVWDNNKFVAVGQKKYGLSVVETSADGIHWNEEWEGPGTLTSIAWNGNKYVAIGYDLVITSNDGKNWKSSPYESGVATVIWTHNQFVAIGYLGTVLTSIDGEQWTEQKTGYDLILTGIA